MHGLVTVYEVQLSLTLSIDSLLSTWIQGGSADPPETCLEMGIIHRG